MLLTGTYTVAGSAASGYTLDALTVESDPALRPQGPDDPTRCGALDRAAVEAAAERLRREPGARAELRTQWGSSPSLWWAVQTGARSAADLGPALDTACAPYRR